MSWRSTFIYLLGGVAGLVATFLLVLFVALATGADGRGGSLALWLFVPVWGGFGYFFLRERELKRLLERILITLALEAFALPLAGLLFALLLWIRAFDPVGEQTVVMGQATGLLLGALGVILGTGIIALSVGGLGFLLFLLLKFNLVHLGRAVKLEAQRRIDERPVVALILVGTLGVLFAIGSARAQASLVGAAPSEPPFSGIWTQPFYAPCVRAALFINHAERGALSALLPLDRLKDRLLGVVGLGTTRETPSLRASRRLLESYVFSTGNPNLRVGGLLDLGEAVDGEIVTHAGDLVERLRVDKRTGALWGVR